MRRVIRLFRNSARDKFPSVLVNEVAACMEMPWNGKSRITAIVNGKRKVIGGRISRGRLYLNDPPWDPVWGFPAYPKGGLGGKMLVEVVF